MNQEKSRRPIRIAGCSGAATDRRHAMALLASSHPNDPIDVIMGDWMSEANMTSRAVMKTEDAGDAYEPTFLESLEPALHSIAKHGIKIAVNAGASDTERLHKVVTDLVRSKGLDLKVAWIGGDEVLPAVLEAQKAGTSAFENLCTGEKLADWKFKPIYAQAYLGGMGIAAALERGADIVVCGRVSDASPVIGAAAWWHGWGRDRLDELANAFVAGHLIECSSYVTGGNFTGFESLDPITWHDLGFPIAEIAHDGQVIITKNANSGGQVSTQTCTSQLLYEIQGTHYYNSDVTAILPNIAFSQQSPNRVALSGVTALPPPPTTKVGLTAPGGHQAEIHFYLTGLSIPQKAALLEAQARHQLTPTLPHLTHLSFTLLGLPAPNPLSQAAATATLRIVAQAPRASTLAPANFLRPVIDNIMQTYPGATPNLDLRLGSPRPIYEYFVTLLPQDALAHEAHLWNGDTISIPPPPRTQTYPARTATEEAPAVSRTGSGPTKRCPLGVVAHARSGDKGSDANVGIWVKRTEWYPWLRATLSTGKIKELLADEYVAGRGIERVEFPNLRAVHFLLRDHLDRGVGCSTTVDVLGKNVAEFLRAREVDVPVEFLGHEERAKL